MQLIEPDRFRYSGVQSDLGKWSKSSSKGGDSPYFGSKTSIEIYRKSWIFLDIPDSPMDFGATSIIVSGLLRIQKADVDLLGPFAKIFFDFWWSGILLPFCFVDQKVG